jgi:uncharacterized membrane protein
VPDYESITASSAAEADFLAAQYKLERQENAKPAEFTVRQGMTKYINLRSNILSPTTIQGYEKIRDNNLQSIMDIKNKKSNSRRCPNRS